MRKGEAGLLDFIKKKKMKVTAKDMEGFSLTVNALLVPVLKPWPNNASRPNVIPSTYWSELRLENKYTRCLCLTFNQNMS